MQLTWKASATTSRQKAILYLAQHSGNAAARKQLTQVQTQTRMLLQYPNLGRPGRRRGTRELVISHTPFIVVYRVDASVGRIEIVQFRHGAQNWPRGH